MPEQRGTNYYDSALTVWKFVKASGVLGSGAGAAIVFPEKGADLWDWLLFAALLSPPVITALKNWYKHSWKPPKGSVDHIAADIRDNLYRVFLFGALGLSLGFLSSGCTTLGQSSVTTRFEETVAPDGTSTTLFEAKSRGEVDASLHQMDYRWGGEENQIVVGQDAAGVTSPAQQALLAGWAQLISNVPGMWNALMGAVSQPPGPAPEGVE